MIKKNTHYNFIKHNLKKDKQFAIINLIYA